MSCVTPGGAVVGRIRIAAVIGRGGDGSVWEHSVLGEAMWMRRLGIPALTGTTEYRKRLSTIITDPFVVIVQLTFYNINNHNIVVKSVA